jgi:hypothetical protein
MQTYFTTSTGPAFGVTFNDPSGNALNLTGASFALTFRCVKNLLKVSGGGSWNTINASAGQATYTLGSTDMANAYALASSVIGTALFGVYAKATISGIEYDGLPFVIEIQKI